MKKTFIIILMLCLLATVGGCSNSSGSTAASQFKSVVEGEIISFGHYEQDGDTSNGSEEIEWIVLTREKGKDPTHQQICSGLLSVQRNRWRCHLGNL